MVFYIDEDRVVEAIRDGDLDLEYICDQCDCQPGTRTCSYENIYDAIEKLSPSYMYQFIFNMPESIKQKLLSSLMEK